MLQSNIRKHNH